MGRDEKALLRGRWEETGGFGIAAFAGWADIYGMRTSYKTFIGFVALLALNACASATAKQYDPAAIHSVQSWFVGFNYEQGEKERITTNTADSAYRVLDAGMPKGDLQFRDDVLFRLKDEHGLTVTRSMAQSTGRIGLTVNRGSHTSSNDIMSADVQLFDTANNVIGRARVTNGNRNATFKGPDDFAKYVADQVAKLIR